MEAACGGAVVQRIILGSRSRIDSENLWHDDESQLEIPVDAKCTTMTCSIEM